MTFSNMYDSLTGNLGSLGPSSTLGAIRTSTWLAWAFQTRAAVSWAVVWRAQPDAETLYNGIQSMLGEASMSTEYKC